MSKKVRVLINRLLISKNKSDQSSNNIFRPENSLSKSLLQFRVEIIRYKYCKRKYFSDDC